MRIVADDPLDRERFPHDEWALIDEQPSADGHTETLFALGNGYLGLRGNLDDAQGGYVQGTFVNGFHETWPIRHAEDAYGLARVGQTIVNVPDGKMMRVAVDGEPVVLAPARRRLDFHDGVLRTEYTGSTAAGHDITVTSERLVSFTERTVAAIRLQVMTPGTGEVRITSSLLNRQDSPTSATASDFDPRKAEAFASRVLVPAGHHAHEAGATLAYRTAQSQLGIAVAMTHTVDADVAASVSVESADDEAVVTITVPGARPVTVTKFLSYQTGDGDLVGEAERAVTSAADRGWSALATAQREWLADFWSRADVRIGGDPAVQQAVRWNLFQLAQATARTDGGGVAAKGVSGSGYSGHYFWDTEIYVMPFLTYTSPEVARAVISFRHRMLPAARRRAGELNQRGALFPWRTVNGEEAGAYYPAGTAQYHINADVAFALMQYVRATGDAQFLADGAIDVLVETARLWADLGFWSNRGRRAFHIHGVTGPDEYTAVVNDNVYTNVSARANLEAAAEAVLRLRRYAPELYSALCTRLELHEAEITAWQDAATGMYIPMDAETGIHPQDAAFLDREPWDFDGTPAEKHPLLLHFHPLVIYRHQVLKQADTVLALFLYGDQFTAAEKRADFDYYDPLTTGDSTLSGVVQSIVAAEVGYHELALAHFRSGVFVDLADLHHNAADGVHVASTGGVWAALVNGFCGFRDHQGVFSFDPRLPETWSSLECSLAVGGTRLGVQLTPNALTLTVLDGSTASVSVSVRGQQVRVSADMPVTVALSDQGPHLAGAPQRRPL